MTIFKKLVTSKEFRDEYVQSHVKLHIPFQIRAMRQDRGWSQAEAGTSLGKSQNAISRLESKAYGKLTLQTLFDVAAGFNVGLLVKFVPLSRLVCEYEDLSLAGLSARGISDLDEVKALELWAAEEALEASLPYYSSAGTLSVSGEGIMTGSVSTVSGSLIPHQQNLFLDVARTKSIRRTQKRRRFAIEGNKPLLDDQATSAPIFDRFAA